MSRKTIPFQLKNDQPNRLNIGCGRHYHPEWTNLDLSSSDPTVICHDVTRGIPFGENNFETVYHSHILEHLDPTQGRELLTECYRVLKPGGVLRIVVPDLESISRLYLNIHDQAWQGDDNASENYHWMKMELLDQMVRSRSGGLMGPYMADISDEKAEFVKSRIGSEFQLCQAPDVEPDEDLSGLTRWERIKLGVKSTRTAIAKWVVQLLMGQRALTAFEESIFRSQGEIHRWMYDRFSLRELCREIGFIDFTVRSAFESQIEGYTEYQLDAIENQIRKPDSLFVECQKPAVSMKASA